jgi:hypothetical protein
MNYLRNSRQRFQTRRIDATIVPDESDGRALCAGHGPSLVSHFLDDTDHAIDVFRRRVVLHDY